MYQFSAPSARGTPLYTYKWFINNAEDPTTDSTLTIPLASNLLTTVMVSVSNQDQTDTTFSANRTAILVNSMMMCKFCVVLSGLYEAIKLVLLPYKSLRN